MGRGFIAIVPIFLEWLFIRPNGILKSGLIVLNICCVPMGFVMYGWTHVAMTEDISIKLLPKD